MIVSHRPLLVASLCGGLYTCGVCVCVCVCIYIYTLCIYSLKHWHQRGERVLSGHWSSRSSETESQAIAEETTTSEATAVGQTLLALLKIASADQCISINRGQRGKGVHTRLFNHLQPTTHTYIYMHYAHIRSHNIIVYMYIYSCLHTSAYI